MKKFIKRFNEATDANIDYKNYIEAKKIVAAYESQFAYEPTNQDVLSKGTIIYNFNTGEEDVIVDYKNGRSSITAKGRVFHVSANVLGGGWKPVRKVYNKPVKIDESVDTVDISHLISSHSKVYVVSDKKDITNPSSRRLFLDKDTALRYWKTMGKDNYTYWEELVYSL